ncbi:hypothetical protein [Nodosilinea sp. P-1105]|uniref:hypothetical protein n=1 Tax=Nodosilinea sp. P-1105 TaxID=2546229 RepID=UPI00146D00D7|nr:hypothetical protein [Nodosilinea sp. P-1105]NMF86423.1 hypothetical protein [Nodosilinea sp. P-1105]
MCISRAYSFEVWLGVKLSRVQALPGYARCGAAARGGKAVGQAIAAMSSSGFKDLGRSRIIAV